MTVRRFVNLRGPHGLHARPASRLVAVARRFESTIVLATCGKRANGKSIFEVLALAAGEGARIEIEADGRDASVAVEALARVLDPLWSLGPPPGCRDC